MGIIEDYKELQMIENVKKVALEIDKYRNALKEIRDLARVNAITTCWTVISNCDDCEEKTVCGIQSPLNKLDMIERKINEVLHGQGYDTYLCSCVKG